MPLIFPRGRRAAILLSGTDSISGPCGPRQRLFAPKRLRNREFALRVHGEELNDLGYRDRETQPSDTPQSGIVDGDDLARSVEHGDVDVSFSSGFAVGAPPTHIAMVRHGHENRIGELAAVCRDYVPVRDEVP